MYLSSLTSLGGARRRTGEEFERIDANKDQHSADTASDLRHAAAPQQRHASTVVAADCRHHDFDV